jgi:hypothetical protein
LDAREPSSKFRDIGFLSDHDFALIVTYRYGPFGIDGKPESTELRDNLSLEIQAKIAHRALQDFDPNWGS